MKSLIYSTLSLAFAVGLLAGCSGGDLVRAARLELALP